MNSIHFSLPRKAFSSTPCMNSKVYVTTEAWQGVYPQNILWTEVLLLQEAEWLCRKLTQDLQYTINNFTLRKEWMSERVNERPSGQAQARLGHHTTQWDCLEYRPRVGLQCHQPLSPEKWTSHQHTCPWAESGLTPAPEIEPVMFRPTDRWREAIQGPPSGQGLWSKGKCGAGGQTGARVVQENQQRYWMQA